MQRRDVAAVLCARHCAPSPLLCMVNVPLLCMHLFMHSLKADHSSVLSTIVVCLLMPHIRIPSRLLASPRFNECLTRLD
jgi:hypothetical protein